MKNGQLEEKDSSEHSSHEVASSASVSKMKSSELEETLKCYSKEVTDILIFNDEWIHTTDFTVRDEIFFDGLYTHFYEKDFTKVPVEVANVIHWFPAVIVSKKEPTKQRYSYPTNLVAQAFRMLGIEYDSDQEIL